MMDNLFPLPPELLKMLERTMDAWECSTTKIRIEMKLTAGEAAEVFALLKRLREK